MPGSRRSSGEGIGYPFQYSWISLMAQMVKNPPAIRETWVQSLGWEDPLEEGMATHSIILAWWIPWAEEPGRLQFMGSQSHMTEWLNTALHRTSPMGQRVKIPLYCRRHRRCGFNSWVGKIPWRRAWQPTLYCCLKNPVDRGAWQSIVQRVTKSQTKLSTHS